MNNKKETRPSASPATVEAATVQGQATLRVVFDNLLVASHKVLPIVGGAVASSGNLVREMRTKAYNQFRNALQAANRIGSERGSGTLAPQTDSAIQGIARPAATTPIPREDSALSGQATRPMLPGAALRAILSRHIHRPAWFKEEEDGTVAGDRISWWVTQFTYEQMEGNREATIKLCNAGLACPESEITPHGNSVSNPKLSSAVAELVEAAAQVYSWMRDHAPPFGNRDKIEDRLRSALEGVKKADRPTDGNPNPTD